MAERRDNRGRLLKLGEGQRKTDLLYYYRWTDAKGKRHCIYDNDLAELRKQEKKITQEIAVGVCRDDITLNEQIELYLGTKNNLAKSTAENYNYYYNHLIKDSAIGNMKVMDIKKSNILLLYKNFADKGMSAGTIKIVNKIINPALKLAVDDNVIFKNPCTDCMKEYAESDEKKYSLTPEQEEEFLWRLNNRPRVKRYRPMWEIVLKTGLRVSEFVGLTWNDIDMDEKTIDINHQVQYRTIGGAVQFFASKTKTNAGTRKIPMSKDVYNLFLEQQKVCADIKKDDDFAVDGYKDFVFLSHVTGRCLNHNNIRRMLRMIVDMNKERDVKLPNISPHILRHTACTRLAEDGMNIKALQYILGHSDVKTLMQVYNHVDIERVKREIERMDRNKVDVAEGTIPKK